MVRERVPRHGALVFAGALLAASHASAAPPALELQAAPLLGPGTPSVDGWFSCMVRLHNGGPTEIVGTIELTSEVAWSSDHPKFRTVAPFAIAPHARVGLVLPTHGFASVPPKLSLRARDTDERVIAEVDVADPRTLEPLLFDLGVPSRIGPALRGMGVPVDVYDPGRGGYGAPLLAVGSPSVNPASGEPVLPDRPAGWASVSVVLARSEQLARLPETELVALANWLLAGGALAVVPSRPEDLRQGPLPVLVGGVVRETAAPDTLGAGRNFFVSQETPEEAAPSVPVPGGGPTPTPAPANLAGIAVRRAMPTEAVAKELRSYEGGSLRPSPWGAAASYGLGEVHLLAFDATREPFVSDEWVKLGMMDLVRHAWDRKTNVALPHAQPALDGGQLDQVRRHLDPNEGTRWTVGVSAVLLLLYAVLAGPLNFYLAARRGKPLRALFHLPIWAAGAMAAIVILGMIGKGLEGRARRLTLVEAGAGMPRAMATRFRGFFASSSDELVVRATDRDGVLDVAGESADVPRELVVDRDGVRLERFRAKPWQTVVVRDDGFMSLGGGISLVDKNGQVWVKNRAARDLVGVVLKSPGKGAVFFDRVPDGGVVAASKGRSLPANVGSLAPGGPTWAPLDAASFSATVDGAAKGLGDAWHALEAVASHQTDWWPRDVPVLVAQLDGGEGKTVDSGLDVEMDRVLVRVVGWGGVL